MNPAAKRLTIDKTTAAGVAGSDVTLAVTASDGATGLTVTWTSSDTGVAAFTKLGAAPMHKILTLLKEGRTTVTAHVDGYEDDSFEFTVTADSMNLWQYPALPVTKQGATFSEATDGGLHIKADRSTGAPYRILSAPVELEAGDYTLTLDGKDTDKKWLTVKVRSGDKDSLSASTGAPATGTLGKGSYTCEVHVLYNAVFENDYTVTLARTASRTATVGTAVVGESTIGKQ